MPSATVYPSVVSPRAHASRLAFAFSKTLRGGPTEGWPTSMWNTRPPARSRSCAAFITSITRNAGTRDARRLAAARAKSASP